MQFRFIDSRFLAGLAVSSFMIAAAGCQSNDAAKGFDEASKPDQAGRILESDLRAYCPNINLREGTAFFSSYAKGGQDDPTKLAYQASIADVTRACVTRDGTLTIDVAAAGKIVPGPAGAPASVTLPIRVVVVRGDEVLYSKLTQFPVSLTDKTAATQFVFNDKGVSVPVPAEQNIRIYAGFDEGPAPKKKTASAE